MIKYFVDNNEVCLPCRCCNMRDGRKPDLFQRFRVYMISFSFETILMQHLRQVVKTVKTNFERIEKFDIVQLRVMLIMSEYRLHACRPAISDISLFNGDDQRSES